MQVKKLAALLVFIALIHLGKAQSASPTDSFKIYGKVKNEKTVTLADLKKYRNIVLGDVNTSCSPKRKEQAHGVKAVLLKEILDSVAFQYERSPALNAFYFKFIASDGYTVVYSFNEVFNTETGNHLYIVTEKDGKSLGEMENRILLLTTSDLKSGNRNIKALTGIVVCQAE